MWCRHITAVVGHHGSAPVKTFIDQALHHPFFYFPCFYLMKGYMEGRPLASTYDKYRAELWENCKALWKIWVPAQLVNFAVVPRHLRIPYVAGISFAWTVVISCMRGALEKVTPTTEEAEGAACDVFRRGKEQGGSDGSGDGGKARAPDPAAPAPPRLVCQRRRALRRDLREVGGRRVRRRERPHLVVWRRRRRRRRGRGRRRRRRTRWPPATATRRSRLRGRRNLSGTCLRAVAFVQ